MREEWDGISKFRPEFKCSDTGRVSHDVAPTGRDSISISPKRDSVKVSRESSEEKETVATKIFFSSDDAGYLGGQGSPAAEMPPTSQSNYISLENTPSPANRVPANSDEVNELKDQLALFRERMLHLETENLNLRRKIRDMETKARQTQTADLKERELVDTAATPLPSIDNEAYLKIATSLNETIDR